MMTVDYVFSYAVGALLGVTIAAPMVWVLCYFASSAWHTAKMTALARWAQRRVSTNNRKG